MLDRISKKSCFFKLTRLFLFCGGVYGAVSVDAKTSDDSAVVDSVTLSNNTVVLYGHGLPTNVATAFNSKDKIIFYFGSIRILNATKDIYDVRIECADKSGNLIFGGDVKRKVTDEGNIGEDKSGRFEISLGLNPAPGVLVDGQKEALKDGGNYYIRTFVNGSLISVTGFSYSIRK